MFLLASWCATTVRDDRNPRIGLRGKALRNSEVPLVRARLVVGEPATFVPCIWTMNWSEFPSPGLQPPSPPPKAGERAGSIRGEQLLPGDVVPLFANSQLIQTSLMNLHRLLFQAVKLIARGRNRDRLRIVLAGRLSPGPTQRSRFFEGAGSRPGDANAIP